MGFRFHKSFKVAPGVRVNISKRGGSVSLGRPGATLNVRHNRQALLTLSAPGTGISYSAKPGRVFKAVGRGIAFVARAVRGRP
jgi:Protein of unknown function (DUF4236)